MKSNFIYAKVILTPPLTKTLIKYVMLVALILQRRADAMVVMVVVVVVILFEIR